MTLNEERLPSPQHPNYVPLEDRIYSLFKTTPLFSFKDVRRAFPEPHDKTIYRALQKLEASNRIRFSNYSNKIKMFTAMGESDLPYITLLTGQSTPISTLIKQISELYSDDGYWKLLLKIDDLPLLLSYQFVIAQMEDSEIPKEYKAWLNKLLDARTVLTTMLGYVESLLKHPSMQGDLQYFKTVFSGTDSALPTAAQITEFKRWYSNEYKRKGSR